jgi:hypothetical protein
MDQRQKDQQSLRTQVAKHHNIETLELQGSGVTQTHNPHVDKRGKISEGFWVFDVS